MECRLELWNQYDLPVHANMTRNMSCTGLTQAFRDTFHNNLTLNNINH